MNRKLRSGDAVTVFGPGRARGRVIAVKEHGTVVTVKLFGSGAKGTRRRRHAPNDDWMSMLMGGVEATRAGAGRPRGRRLQAGGQKGARGSTASRAAAAGGPGHERRGAR